MLISWIGKVVPQDFNDPTDWTLIQEWDTRDTGELTNIKGTYTTNRGHGFAWSPDGTKLTLCNSSDDNIKTFSCSTAFDPDSASATPSATRSVTNPQALQYNNSGTRAYVNFSVGDVIQAYPASDWTIGGGAVQSDLSKSDVGFTGTSDGVHSIEPEDEDQILWFGQTGTAEELKKMAIVSGDLDSFSVLQTQGVNPPFTSINLQMGASVLNKDKDKFYVYDTNGHLSLATMTTALDLTTLSFGTLRDLKTQFSLSWDPRHVWIDWNDTSEVWIQGDQTSSSMQLARIATNI